MHSNEYGHMRIHGTRIFIFRFLALFSAILSLLFFVIPSRAQETTPTNEFIFQVIFRPDWFISEAIFAYEQNGKYYLPIVELSKGFEFYIESDPDRKYVKGFSALEEDNFVLDADRHELIFKGVQEDLAEDAILTSEDFATDDLYVQLEVLDKIWPVSMHLDLSRLTIFAESEEDLPFMRRKKREKTRLITEARKEAREQQKELLPRRENPYQLIGKPVLDYQSIYQFHTKEDDLVGQNIFNGKQQIGKVLADYSASFQLIDGEIERPDSIRLKFHRQSAGDEYFFVPGLRYFEAGDINLRQRDLISNTAGGRGFMVSNDNRNRSREFNHITIIGTGPPGWETELYNNDELIDFGVVADDGEYIFEDVVINFGNNEIKILFFGPQGQVREELRSYNASGSMLSPGDFTYQAGLLDTDRSFILLDNEARTEPRGVTQTGNMAYGVNDWLTVFGNYTQIPFSDREHQYVTGGAAFSTPIGLMEAEAYKDFGGGEAVSLDFITELAGWRTNLRNALFRDFESQDSGFGSNKKSFESQLQLNKNVKLGPVPLGIRVNAKRTERKSGNTSTDLDITQSYSRSGLRLSHTTSTHAFNDEHQQTTGTGTATIREGNWQFRGGLNYDLHPSVDLSSMNGEVRYKLDNGFQTALNASHNFKTSDYRAGLQIGYDFQKFLGTAEMEYERDNGFEFVVRATTSLHPYTDDDSYDFSSASGRNLSPVRGHIFLDKNADGIFNEGDEPLPGVKLRFGGARSKEKSDEKGYIIANAPANRLMNIMIDKRTLEDPYLVPAEAGFSAVPVYGKILDASFPVVETGAIEGFVYRASNKRVVTGLTLRLLNTEGKVVMETETAFDGYYTFEFVPPGNYTILAEESSGVQIENGAASISSEDLFLYGKDLFIVSPASDINEGELIQAQQGGEQGEEEEIGGEEEAPVSEAVAVEPAAGPVNAIQDIRFKSRKGKVRLVLDLAQSTDYDFQESSDSQKMTLHLTGVTWDGPLEKTLDLDQKTYRYIVEPAEEGGVNIIFEGSEPVEVSSHMMLEPSDGDASHRLLVDLL